ncbi:MAG: GNAT family N-acetyltransferase [Candidatus Nanopelagicales bacterium]
MSPAPDDHQRDLHRTLLEALDGDPFVRFELDPGTLAEVAVVPGVAVAWVGRHRSGVRWTTGLAADPADPAHIAAAVDLLVPLARAAAEAGSPVSGVTVSRGGRDLLPPDLRQPQAWEWDLWWTAAAPDPDVYAVPGGAVTDLDPGDPRIGALLETASPTAAIPAGDPRVVRWAGVEDPDGPGQSDTAGTGGLVGLLALTHHRSGAHHLNDVATHPARRGRRIARLVCGEVTRQSLEAGAPAVTLGMYADNDPARALYTGLGFTCVRGQTSGPLHPDQQ